MPQDRADASPRRRWPRRPEPYTTFARLYDILSLEWPLYRSGRIAAIELLDLRRGDRVLDLGCGTGLNLAHLQRRIGPTGAVIALDVSGHMLRQAARRTRRRGWHNVTFVQADAASVDERPWAPVDAVLATYVLSVVADPVAAWRTVRRATRPGGRVAVVDMREPRGRWRFLRRPARWLCAVSRADIGSHPWLVLERELDDVRATSRRGEHLQVRVGTVPARVARPPRRGEGGGMSTHDSSDVDHPRSDDVKGRETSGYGETAGYGDRGYGDRGQIGDQGTGSSMQRREAEPDEPERPETD